MQKKRILLAVIAGINVAIGAMINYWTYDFVGIGIFIINLVVVTFLKDTQFAHWLVHLEIRSYDVDSFFEEENINQLLVSIALLSIDIKICAAIGMIIEGLSALFIALAILIACGYLIEGSRSGMTIGGAMSIGKILARIGSALMSIWEKIVILIVKAEFKLFGVELKKE